MGGVAALAGVSKSLVHYHFRDKDSLLLALAERTGGTVLDRARREKLDGARALDGYRAWLQAELDAGDLRVLMALAESESPRLRAALRRLMQERRHLATQHVARVFESLSLAPRHPPELLAETVLAFVDGLSLQHALEPDRDPLPAFDALWLALLTLAE